MPILIVTYKIFHVFREEKKTFLHKLISNSILIANMRVSILYKNVNINNYSTVTINYGIFKINEKNCNEINADECNILVERTLWNSFESKCEQNESSTFVQLLRTHTYTQFDTCNVTISRIVSQPNPYFIAYATA